MTAADLAERVLVRDVLERIGGTVRARRADCPIAGCEGHSRLTLAISGDGRLWRCHRCQAGGDVYTLLQQVRGCRFPEALAEVAGLAGVRLDAHIPRE